MECMLNVAWMYPWMISFALFCTDVRCVSWAWCAGEMASADVKQDIAKAYAKIEELEEKIEVQQKTYEAELASLKHLQQPTRMRKTGWCPCRASTWSS